MIPVAKVAEPATFAALARKPGQQWLTDNPDATRPKPLWIPFTPALAEGFHELCAYAAMCDPTGGTVDHYLSYKNHPQLAYEWSNYRFASGALNACKRTADEAVLDPYEVGQGWFEILLPSLQMRVTDAVPAEIRAKAEYTLTRLKLRDGERILRWRQSWYAMYLQGELTLEGLRRVAPLIAQAVDNTKTPAASAAPKPAPASANYTLIRTQAELDAWLARLQAAPVVSLDTETTSLDSLRARLVGLSFSLTPGEAAYLPLMHRDAGGLLPDQLSLDAALATLKPWLENPQAKKLGQNLKYDRHVLANHGVQLAGVVDDTLLASYVLESHLTHNMDDLAERHLGVSTQTYEALCGKGAKQIGFDEVDIDAAGHYAAEDADITLRLAHAFAPQLHGALEDVYRRIELPTAEVLFAMERTGVLIDRDELARQSHQLGQRIQQLEARAYELAGQPFNMNSPKQLQEILFGRLGIDSKGLKKTPTGAISVNEDALEKLAADHPLPKLLLEYRGLAKLKSTYTDKLPTMIHPDTGRVHTHYSQAVAVTGRLASSDPNLQNIPVRTEEGRRVRKAFIAPPGWQIVSADYSQIELRIMAHLSDDPRLLQAFADGEDIHRATAAEVFAVPLAEVSSQQRRYAKTINFGLIYGMSAFGLAAQLEIDRSAAQSFIDRYFARYPGVADYMARTREHAREQGYVETVFGRRLWLPDIHAANAMKRQGAERAAINAPMQGTAADLIKLAMIEVQHWLRTENLRSRLIMQVHDELVLEAPADELDTVKAGVVAAMARVAQLKTPLVAEVGSGDNWEAAH